MDIRLLCSAAVGVAMLAAGMARADTPIYKWVDDKGQVHYSTLPHGDTAKQLPIQNTATPHAGTDVTPVPGASTTAAPADATLMQPKQDDSPECKASRERLFKFLHSDKLYSLDAQGNKVPLSAEDAQRAVDDARSNVKQACGGGT